MRAGKENGLVIPAASGQTGLVLTTNGDGTVSWAAPSSAAPGGSSGQIQFNNAGSFSGETGLTWTPGTSTLGLMDADTGIFLTSITNEPSAQTSNGLRLYAKNIGGRVMPKYVGPSGLDVPMASAPWANGFSLISTGSGTVINVIGCTVTTVGTVSTPTLAATNLKTQTRRFNIASSTTAGTLGSLRVPVTECYRGNAAGLGGFFMVARFSLTTLQSGMRAFIGLVDTTAAPTNVDPLASTTPGKIGMGINTNSGNWFITSCASGTTPTLINLGATNFPINTTDMLELILFNGPFSATVTYRVTNLTTNASTSGTLGTNLPATTTFLTRAFWTCNNATAASTAMDCSRFYLETDY